MFNIPMFYFFELMKIKFNVAFLEKQTSKYNWLWHERFVMTNLRLFSSGG